MIELEKRKAIFLLHQEGMPSRRSPGGWLGRNTVRRIIAQEGRVPARSFTRPLTRNSCADSIKSATLRAARLGEAPGRARPQNQILHPHPLAAPLGISLPAGARCDRVPDQREPRCSTTPVLYGPLGSNAHQAAGQPPLPAVIPNAGICSLPRLRSLPNEVLPARALRQLGLRSCRLHIDNTNLARLRGLGAQAVIVPEMEAFAKATASGSSAMRRNTRIEAVKNAASSRWRPTSCPAAPSRAWQT